LDGIERIRAEILNDYSFARAGFVCEQAGELGRAVEQYRKALQLNPGNAHAHERLGHILCNRQREFGEGLPHCREAVRLNPGSGQAHFVLGMALFNRGDPAGAIQHLSAALRGFADGTDINYTPAAAHSLLGSAYLLRGSAGLSARHFEQALRSDPNLAEVRYYLAIALTRQELLQRASEEHEKACRLKPELRQWPDFYDLMSLALARNARIKEAAGYAQKALVAAKAIGDRERAQALERRLREYRDGP
jgi:tetratricopeptide (TPR) repeat protein